VTGIAPRSTKKLVLGDAPPLVASAPSPVHHPEPASSYSPYAHADLVIEQGNLVATLFLPGDRALSLVLDFTACACYTSKRLDASFGVQQGWRAYYY
jgi:hypothetical protein